MSLDLDPIKRRLAAATPGPWRVKEGQRSLHRGTVEVEEFGPEPAPWNRRGRGVRSPHRDDRGVLLRRLRRARSPKRRAGRPRTGRPRGSDRGGRAAPRPGFRGVCRVWYPPQVRLGRAGRGERRRSDLHRGAGHPVGLPAGRRGRHQLRVHGGGSSRAGGGHRASPP